MDVLDRLGWVAERAYAIGGAGLVVRSTSSDFLAQADKDLEQFRSEHAEKSFSPVLSVVAPPRSSSEERLRRFHVGYLNHVEVFRYRDAREAHAALIGAVDRAARMQLAAQRVALAVEVVVLGSRPVILFGPGTGAWIGEMVAAGGVHLHGSALMLDLGTAQLVGWPLRVVHVPEGLDRRGRPLAPFGGMATEEMLEPTPVSAVVRAAPRAGTARVLGEVMSCCSAIGSEESVFAAVAGLLDSAVVVQGARPHPRALARLGLGAGQKVPRLSGAQRG